MSRWNGTNLRVVSPAAFAPFVFLDHSNPNGKTKLYGLYGSFLSNLTAAMGMTYEVVSASDNEYGISHPDADKLTGMLRSLHLKEADIAMPGFYADLNIFTHMRYAPFYLQTSTVFWTAMEHAFETQPAPYVNAFDAATWIFLLVSVIALTAFHSLEGKILRREALTGENILESFLGVLQSLLQEASKNRYSGADRVLGGVWMLASFVLMQYFSGDLKANSVIQSPTLRINSLQDLAEHRDKYKLMYPIETPVMDDLATEREKIGRTLDVILEEGVPLKVEEYFRAEKLKFFVEGHGVLCGETFGTGFMVSQFCRTTNRLYYVSDRDDWNHYMVMLMGAHLDKDLTDEIHRRMSIVISMGVPFATSREVAPGSWNCVVTNKNSKIASESLSFADVSFSFMSHFIFMLFCFSVLGAEMVVFRRTRRTYEN